MAKILVVDDEPDIIRLMQRILKSRGHEVSVAYDGQAALDLVASDPPDILVLDLDIPRIDGFEVCRRIKTDEATRHIPVVMVTAAYTSVSDAGHGTGLGADEFIVKPFLKEVLIHNIERLLPKAPAA